ncbi:cytosolic sulfotransferase 7-like [Phoenix dactylifera]|uniref:Sulfotransferase n=1 Tax=Phoenix dactylifera TaxID=42345 RepID=A0A8B7BUP4_PHODC|nr:cytosolic sulfotransferase 7-like [Phoenix dactylifera]
MATLPPPPTGSLPEETQKEKKGEEQNPTPLQEYDDLISTLPLDEGWLPVRLRKYQGSWFPELNLPGVIAIQQHFKARPTDLFVLSFPKAGTTWLKALTFAITTRTQHPLAHHPLHSLNPHQCVVTMDRIFALGQASTIEAMPSPRILSTHMPFSLLRDSIEGSGCRIIYVCRDVKDVLVSWWHFNDKMRPPEMDRVPFAKALEMFCEGICPSGPIWSHVLEYWEESLRRPEKVLFLKYEEMMEEPMSHAKRLAEFMGCPFSLEEEREGVVEEILKLCSFEKLRNLEVNKTHKRDAVHLAKFDSLFRKGKVGDWRNHMSPEMARKLDEITQQNFKDSGFTV